MESGGRTKGKAMETRLTQAYLTLISPKITQSVTRLFKRINLAQLRERLFKLIRRVTSISFKDFPLLLERATSGTKGLGTIFTQIPWLCCAPSYYCFLV